MRMHSDSFKDGDPIPAEFAFGKIGDPVTLSDNRNPHLAWSEVPSGTRSFVLLCVDPDAPSKPDDVNKPDRSVPAGLERVEFVHWVMANIPQSCRELPAGAYADGITEHGKKNPEGPPGSVQGINSYTDWFAGDDDMKGDYYGYDGPCPPWNDSIMHHYHFTLHALDVAALDLPERFTIEDVREAMTEHVMTKAHWMGTYSLNPKIAG